MDLCQTAHVQVAPDHPAAPPKGALKLVFWSALVPVKPSKFNLWGGDITGPITCLVQHWYTPLKNITSTQYVF